MIKHLSLLLMLLGGAVSATAQAPKYGATTKHFKDFRDRPLQVVLTGNKSFDSALTEALEAHWNYSEINLRGNDADLEDDFTNDDYYFLTSIAVVYQDVFNINYLTLIRGGEQKGGNLNPRRAIFMSPVNIITEVQVTNMAWRIAPVIKLMNDAMTKIRDEKTAINSATSGVKYMNETYSERRGELEDKTLLIDQNYIQPDDFDAKGMSLAVRVSKKSLTADDVAAIYPYKFEVVSQGEMAEAIAEKRKNTAVLSPISSADFTAIIYDAATLEPLFYYVDAKAVSLSKKFFKQLVK